MTVMSKSKSATSNQSETVIPQQMLELFDYGKSTNKMFDF